MNKQELIECIEQSTLRSRRYADTVKIYCLLNDSVKAFGNGVKLRKMERKLKRLSDNRELELDMLVQNNASTFTIFEITTSVSHKPEHLEKEIRQIIDRDSDFLDEQVNISISDVVLLCHQEDAQLLLDTYNRMVAEKKIVPFSKNFCMATHFWYRNTGGIEALKIKWFNGNPNGNVFLDQLKNNDLNCDAPSLALKVSQERFYFANRKPPIPYLSSELEAFINTELNEILRSPEPVPRYRFNMADFIQSFKDKKGNEYSCPLSEWVKEGLAYLEKCTLIKIENDTFIAYVDMFSRPRKVTDRYQFYAKLECKSIKQARPPSSPKSAKKPNLTEAEKSHYKPLFGSPPPS
ncbi:MAG: hypothetical protein QXL94_05845 [Candidatus Parvarchaeum sp.]